jgi:allantoicase
MTATKFSDGGELERRRRQGRRRWVFVVLERMKA